MNRKSRDLNRRTRTRGKIRSISDRVRLSIHRSNKYLYAQLIDDASGKTLVGISEKQVEKLSGTKVEKAKLLGTKLAELAKTKKILLVVFDKGSYTYHGRVKAFAEGAREGGLQF